MEKLYIEQKSEKIKKEIVDIENELSKLEKTGFKGEGITKRQRYLNDKLIYYNSELLKIDNDVMLFAATPQTENKTNK